MAYDERIAARVRRILAERNDVREIKMFGGLCFTVGGHMACGVLGADLIVRLGPERWAKALRSGGAKPFTFTGKSLKGIAVVEPPNCDDARKLRKWMTAALEFVAALPPKKPRKNRGPMPRPRRRLA